MKKLMIGLITVLAAFVMMFATEPAFAGEKLYVGNLSWNTTDDSLREAFTTSGNVIDVTVFRDRDTGRSRGFGFVTMSSQSEAINAISALNDQEVDGRRIKVVAASKRPSSSTDSSGGYTGGGGDYSYNGGRGF